MPGNDDDVPPTRAAAKALVGRIANYHGNLSEDICK